MIILNQFKLPITTLFWGMKKPGGSLQVLSAHTFGSN